MRERDELMYVTKAWFRKCWHVYGVGINDRENGDGLIWLATFRYEADARRWADRLVEIIQGVKE
jgi:hypothetical protein